MTEDECYNILGVKPGASPAEIKQARDDLVRLLHPDRLGSEPGLRDRAQERLKQVNVAYDQMKTSGFQYSGESGGRAEEDWRDHTSYDETAWEPDRDETVYESEEPDGSTAQPQETTAFVIPRHAFVYLLLGILTVMLVLTFALPSLMGPPLPDVAVQPISDESASVEKTDDCGPPIREFMNMSGIPILRNWLGRSGTMCLAGASLIPGLLVGHHLVEKCCSSFARTKCSALRSSMMISESLLDLTWNSTISMRDSGQDICCRTAA